ncbi:insulinase family protein [Myxococcus sp. K15C18031901]|uniref:M16 family metallopeptidase n=1 Tax=Myxococcus dinghuensis TaxID=2906761 RepID=UPI0020A6F773|nr:pitrilysin family protein [Myxococcus dinghuensis]MCP3098862.1 insulinase family protein [Myxococcus dinghuensis]
MKSQRLLRPPSAGHRWWRGGLVLFASLLCACASLPPRGQVVMRDVSFPLRDFRMASGLRVVVEQDRRAPVVAVVAVVGAGGSSDPEGKEGLAHVVEHLAFRARAAGGPSVLTRQEELGVGHANAFTSLDYTLYQTLAPKESLPELLKMEGQRLMAPLGGISPEVFAVEREVVRNELRQRNETGFVGQVFSWMHAAAFPAEHPYSRPVIGTHESLSALTLQDAQRFARGHYRPENMTLVIAGDVDLAAVEAVLTQNLPPSWVGTGAPLAVGTRLPQVPEPPVRPAPATIPEFQASVAAPELYISWVLPRGFDEASAIHDFVRVNLRESVTDSQRNDGDIAGFSSHLIAGTRASLLVIRVELSTGANPRRSADKVLDQVMQTWKQDIDAGKVLGREYDFQALRRNVITGMVLESEDLLERTIRRAELTHFMLDVRGYSRSQMALMAIDGGRVTDFAYKWLQRDRARVILVRPGEQAGAAVAAPAALPEDTSNVAPSRRVTPSMLSALTSPVQVMKLDNGMEVLLVPRPGLPVVRVGAMLGGGSTYGEKNGVAELASSGAFREAWFEGHPSHWGLHTGSRMSRDNTRFAVAGTAGNVGNMLAMLTEWLSSTRTSEDVVRFLREQVLPRRKATDLHPEVQAERAMHQALYGTHPYGRDATGAELEQVSLSEAQAWISDVYRPGNAVVVIAGEFDVKTVEPLVREYLGGWKHGPTTAVTTPPAPELPAPSANPRTFVMARPGASQGHLELACRLPTATPAAEARYALMAELVELRATHKMRAQTGASYGFGAQPWIARGGASHLMVEGLVDARRMAEGAKFVQDMMSSFAANLGEEELAQARSRLLARQAVGYISSEAWVDALLAARRRGFSPEDLANRPAYLQAVTPAALRKEFDDCRKRLVVGVVADEGQARTALQALSAP